MIVTFVILLFLIGITLRQEQKAAPKPGKPAWYPYRKAFALILLILVPVVLVNLFVPNQIGKTPDERIALGEKNHDRELIILGHQDLEEQYRDSLELQFDYIDAIALYHPESLKDFPNYWDSTGRKKETIVLSHFYASLLSDEKYLSVRKLNKLPKDYPFVQLFRVLGRRVTGKISYEQSEYGVWRELSNYPENGRAYELLWKMYESKDKVKLDHLLHNPTANRFIPVGYRSNYYFMNGQVGWYVKAVIESRLLSVSLLALISAFLVSFVWVIFLRSMDVFNREKWLHLAIVFVAGALFTFLCLPLYDYANLVLDFRISGSGINDFLYCFLVIGGSEEVVKFLPWILFGLLTRKLKEPYDYILYASIAALGFAFTENLMYLDDYGSIVVRSILSTVGHMFDASVVAYSFILARYKFKQPVWKLVTPVIGFILAALCHGFYDFWLISEAVADYYFVTILFFIFSLHVWFFFKNNAMNNSGFFSASSVFNAGFQQDLLTFSILGLLAFEFLVISLEFGSQSGNHLISQRAVIVAVFLVYVSIMLHRIDLRQGVWQRWRFRMPSFSGGFLRMPFGGGYDEEEEDFTGLALRLFAPKTNPYIGDKLPKSGTCVRKISVNNDPNWYVFELNTPINYHSYVPSHVVLKNKLPEQSLDQPKIEIYFLFIPDIHILQQESVNVKQLRYAGRAYSMPI